MLGFESDGNFGEISKGWEVFFTAFFYEIFVKRSIVVFDGVLDDGMVGLEGLDNGFGGFEMTTTDTTDNLSDELKSAFFGGKIRESEPRISLNDADGGKLGQIKTFRNGLSANNNIKIAGFNLMIECIKGLTFGVIGIKTDDFGGFEELF